MTWVRNAIRWLVAFNQTDQSFTRLVSIRSAIGELGWSNALKDVSTSGQIRLQFLILPELFAEHNHVRLRGISGFVYGSKDDSPWSACIKLPKQGLVVMTSGRPLQIDQSTLPPCYLGRLSTYNNPRAPEIAGMISLMNASPIGAEGKDGELYLEIRPAVKNARSLAKLDDVVLELNVVGQPN